MQWSIREKNVKKNVYIYAIKKADRQRINAFNLVLEKTLESPLDSKKIQPVNLRGDQPLIFTGKTCWSWSSSILVTWFKQMARWKSPWSWERLRAEGEEGVRGWDVWTAPLMQWTWTWANSGRWWGKGRLGALQSVGSQRVRHDWVTEQQHQIYIYIYYIYIIYI